MLETLNECPSCGHTHYDHYITCKDYTVSNEAFDITKCQNCQLLFTNPRPKASEIAKYYESEDYISHHNKSRSLIDLLYKLVRKITLRNKINLIRKYGHSGSILDIGCGTGFFLEQAQQSGWTVEGMEPNDTARSLTEQKGIRVHSSIDQITDDTYSNITLWHVLEHIYDLSSFLNRLHGLLNKNGTIFIAVPNYRSYDAQIYDHRWAAYDVPRHLYHFDQDTMRSTLQRHNLKIVDIQPMKFDAFYVSLLSDKNTNPSYLNYIKFLINGVKSNINAVKNNQNYSSLIYIIKKSL